MEKRLSNRVVFFIVNGVDIFNDNRIVGNRIVFIKKLDGNAAIFGRQFFLKSKAFGPIKIIAELEKRHNGIHLRGLSRLVKTGLPNAKRFIDILEKEKQNLLQDIEKDKQLRQKLAQQNLELKEYLRAGKMKVSKLFKAYNGAEKVIDQLNSNFSLLRAENTSLLGEKERIVKENEGLKAKLSSIIELKNAVRQLKKQAQNVVERDEGYQEDRHTGFHPFKPAESSSGEFLQKRNAQGIMRNACNRSDAAGRSAI